MTSISVKARRLLRGAIEEVDSARPHGTYELPRLEYRFHKMFWQNHGRCVAINLLLENGLLDEAAIILRPLMADAQRLMYAAKNPGKRESLALRLELELAHELKSMAQLDANLGRPPDGTNKRADNHLRSIEQDRIARGIKKLEKFPEEGKNIASALGRESDRPGHKLYSILVHGKSLSPIPERLEMDDGTIRQSFRSNDPIYILGIAEAATEYLYESAIAAGEAQKWSTLDRLVAAYGKTTQRFEALNSELDS